MIKFIKTNQNVRLHPRADANSAQAKRPGVSVYHLSETTLESKGRKLYTKEDG